MSKFKVGDRVAVYYQGCPRRNYATIQLLREDNEIEIVYDYDPLHVFKVHEKQCRRLIKKKRREIWVFKNDFNEYVGAPTISYDEPLSEVHGNWIKFREVKD